MSGSDAYWPELQPRTGPQLCAEPSIGWIVTVLASGHGAGCGWDEGTDAHWANVGHRYDATADW